MQGQLLNKNKQQEEALKNRKLFESNIEDRYHLFEERFIDKEIRNSNETLPIEAFYPTKDFTDVISEVKNQLPTNFNIVGKEADFLRNSLIEGSNLKSLISAVYKEGLLTSRAFVLMKPKLSTSGSELMKLQFDVLPFENCFPTYDVLTGELKQLTFQEKRVYHDVDKEVYFLYTVEYTKETIKTYIRDLSGRRIPDLPDNSSEDNPFKAINILPVVEFKCYSQQTDAPYASKIVESQLQLDNLNTNLENLTNMHTNPIYVIENTRRAWDGFPIGAGQILTLQDKEKFYIEKSDMQLVPLDTRYNRKKDEIYKTGGLVPPSLREKMYGTDSSKVVKIASSELIGFARILMNNFKQSLMVIAEVILFINGKKLTDEIVSPPNEILPYDLESVFNFMAVGMTIGLVDEEWFWDKYMPELSQSQRERIKERFKEKQSQGLIDEKQANINNRAKAPTKPMGNKEQANTSKEDRDGKISK